MQRRLLLSCLAFVLALVAGCASVSRPPGTPLPADLHDLDRWQARGRLGVAGPDSGGSGSFDWQQHGDRADVQIRGPVGIGSVRLQVRGDGPRPALRLETSGGEVLESEAAWTELEARLGAAVPAGNLRYWMLGLAAPGKHQWSGLQDNAVPTLEQGGWRIEYPLYSDEPGARVPMRIRAVSDDARVRIVIDRWRLGQ